MKANTTSNVLIRKYTKNTTQKVHFQKALLKIFLVFQTRENSKAKQAKKIPNNSPPFRKRKNQKLKLWEKPRNQASVQ